MLMQRSKHVPGHLQAWGVDLAAVVTVFVLTCWIAYSDRHPAPFLGSLEVQRSVAVDEQVPLPPARGISKLPAVPLPVEEPRIATLLQRVGGAENEVVHIGEDVTVRYLPPIARRTTN